MGSSTPGCLASMLTASQKPQHLAEGRGLKNTLLIATSPNTATLTVDMLLHIRMATSKALGYPCLLHLVRCATFDDALVSFLVVTSRNAIIAVYELTDYCTGVRCNRVCDNVVRTLLANN